MQPPRQPGCAKPASCDPRAYSQPFAADLMALMTETAFNGRWPTRRRPESFAAEKENSDRAVRTLTNSGRPPCREHAYHDRESMQHFECGVHFGRGTPRHPLDHSPTYSAS